MRVAIIADIHGNLHALNAVLADLDTLGVDRLIVNGDVVNRGPDNVAVLERLHSVEATYTTGNHDQLVYKWADRDASIPADWYADPFWGATVWTVEQLQRAGWLDRLRGWPLCHAIAVPGAPRVLVTHGSPRHIREGYGPRTDDSVFTEVAAAYDAAIFVGSHTHRPLERRIGNALFLNTGAVGTPFNHDPNAQYLLLTLARGAWTWEFRSIEYDRAAAIAAFAESGLLAQGGLSARIFYEELRLASAIYPRFWFWAESTNRLKDWQAWHDFLATMAASGTPIPVEPDGASHVIP